MHPMFKLEFFIIHHILFTLRFDVIIRWLYFFVQSGELFFMSHWV